MEWFLKVIKEHYADFDGRARRKEYWMFFLFNVIIVQGFNLIAITTEIGLFAIISTIVSLGLLVPAIAVGVRRMHDVGKSGWYLLIPIYSLILACTDSTPGENQYGKNPKGVGNNSEIDLIGNE